MSLLAVKKVDEFTFPVNLPGEEADAPKSSLIVKRSAGFALQNPAGVILPSPLPSLFETAP